MDPCNLAPASVLPHVVRRRYGQAGLHLASQFMRREKVDPPALLENKGVMFVVYRRLNAGRSLLLVTSYDGEDTLVGVGLFFCLSTEEDTTLNICSRGRAKLDSVVRD
ncbi:unnamed protein product [Pylaiella littoralis]